jgi:hypothetical protein
MKKFFKIFATLVLSAGMLAPQGLSAQKRVVKVQGHPHEYLTTLHGGREDAMTKTRAVSGSTADINLADIQCWAGSPDATLRIDSAVLLVKWTDGKLSGEIGDSIVAWGYQWNPVDRYDYPVKKYTIDMIRAVANADCRFSVLLQNSSGGDFVVGGFGLNMGDFARIPLYFDAQGAASSDSIDFDYASPNCRVAQGAAPYDVEIQVEEAIRRSTDGRARGTGIIRHPFDADYGYPAYDFDFWTLPNPDLSAEFHVWQAGWRRGYWAFFTKDQLDGPFTYSDIGIATREIHNRYVDGFVFETDPNVWPPQYDMSGDYFAVGNCLCICGSSPDGKKPVKGKNVIGKRK